MTYDEAVTVLTFMMAAWPSAKSMSDDAADLWVHDLERLELEPCFVALERMRRTEDYAPTLARFLGAYQAVVPRTYHEAIGAGSRDATVSTPVIAAMREGLKTHLSKEEHANSHIERPDESGD